MHTQEQRMFQILTVSWKAQGGIILTVPKACLSREAVLRQKTGKGKTENPQKL
jgi:hypothetical protein